MPQVTIGEIVSCQYSDLWLATNRGTIVIHFFRILFFKGPDTLCPQEQHSTAEIRISMSPPPRKDGKKGNFMARLIGGASSGVLELAFFHPVDTVAKRLMASKVNVSSRAELSSVLFLEASGGTVGQKYRALFPGIGFAAGYKILQRSYKFGGQPYAREFTDNLLGDRLSTSCAVARNKQHACSGLLQTNPLISAPPHHAFSPTQAKQ